MDITQKTFLNIIHTSFALIMCGKAIINLDDVTVENSSIRNFTISESVPCII